MHTAYEAHGIRAGVDLLTSHEQTGRGVLRAQVLAHRREHPPGARRRVVDAAVHGLARDGRVLVTAQQQVDHEGDDLARGEVLTSGLVARLGELAVQLLEDRPHLGVADVLGTQVELGELLDDQVERIGLLEPLHLLLEPEPGEHVADVVAEAVDVGQQVGLDVGAVAGQRGEGVGRGVVERVLRGLAQLDVQQVLGHPVTGALLLGQHGVLRRCQDAIQPAQDRHRQDDIALLLRLVRPAEQVGDGPDEVRVRLRRQGRSSSRGA